MSVKTMIFGFAAMGVGGAALTSGGFGGGHDAERMVARPPAEVYAAISSMSPEGVLHRDPAIDGPRMAFEVTKEPGKAVHWVVRVDGKVAGSLDLAVAPDKDGTSRLSADIDFDRAAIRKVMPGGEEVLAMPDAVFNIAAQGLLGEMAKKIEAGMPLESFSPDDLAAWEGPRPGGGDAGGSLTGHEIQGADVTPRPIQPTASAEPRPIQPTAGTDPMLDPNKVADDYLKGGQ